MWKATFLITFLSLALLASCSSTSETIPGEIDSAPSWTWDEGESDDLRRADVPETTAIEPTAQAAQSPGDVTVPGASTVDSPGGDEAFWSALGGLCGNAYRGLIVDLQPKSTSLGRRNIALSFLSCADAEIRVPIKIGDDDSRTWVFRRTGDGLAFDHQHTGAEYRTVSAGGQGLEHRFRVASSTASNVPQIAHDVWTIAIEPGQSLTCVLEGEPRRMELAFDLSSPLRR